MSTDAAEALYRLPASWEWCRLSDVGAIVGGGTPPSGDLDNFAPPGQGIAWLTPADLGQNIQLDVTHGRRDLTDQGLRESSATVLPKGSVLFTSRAPIGYTAIAAGEVSTNQGFKSVVPYLMELSRFIAVYFKAFAPWINSQASGTTFREVSAKVVSALPFPLPPLAEQHRIVAKIDELMALCDELEAAQAERERRRDRVVVSSLRRLSQPSPEDGEVTFREQATFHLDRLPRLTTRIEHVKHMRETILELAVCGRLLTQSRVYEPVHVQLAANDTVRKATAAQDQRADFASQRLLVSPGNYWPVPETWQWRGLADLVLFIDYRGKTPDKVPAGMRLITAKNIRKGFISRQPEEFVSEQTYSDWMTRGLPRVGDVLFTTEAPMGNAAVVDIDERFALAQRVINFRGYGAMDPRFLVLVLLAKPFQTVLDLAATGLTAKGIKAAKLKRLPIAVAPMDEQRRIVAKVDELMALCDQLETALRISQTEKSRLLEAVLHEALEPAV
ncbi:MAG: restriction endonuclease subunit S [Vicinamibacterales bacterium]